MLEVASLQRQGKGTEKRSGKQPAPYLRKHKKSYQQRWESTFGKSHDARWDPWSVVELVRKEGRTMILLIIIGVCASVLDFAIELSVIGLNDLRTEILTIKALNGSVLTQFATWVSFTAIIAVLAMILTRFIDPIAAGSGIPEMKTIISCDQRKEADHFLGRRTLISKAVGLALALGSGISVGKEGPFVHMASIIAHSLMKHVSFFQRIFNNNILRRHMYNAACAVGVASTFRAPIGGVLFAIEVTSTVFMVTNYWRAFVAAISGSLARQLVRMAYEADVTTFRPMFPTSFAAKSFSYPEFAAFAVLGIFMGVAGAGYVTLSSVFRTHWKAHTSTHPLLWSSVSLLIACCLLYIPGEFSRLSIARTLNDLFSPTELGGVWSAETSGMPLYVLLPLAALVRLVATTFSTTLPLPAGDFIPTFAAGTVLGRFFGEALQAAFPDSGIVPGGYALVGGAAFVGSATHTMSVAVIALEFTGQFVYMTPLIVAVLLASGIGAALSVSLYESVIISKGLTYLPLLRVNQLEGFKAHDVMAIEIPLVPMETTARHLRCTLDNYPAVQSFPVVDDVESMVFFGCVSREAVEALCAATVPEVNVLTPASPAKLDGIRPQTSTNALSSPTLRWMPSPRGKTKKAAERSLLSTVNLRHFPSVAIDSSVLQVDSDTPVQTVHLLFEMLKTSTVWVTRRGRLIGLIRRKQLHACVTSLRQETAPIAV